MEKLYAPWRTDYVKNLEPKKEKNKNDCVFCQAFSESEDEKHWILKRFKHCALMLNKYPYNPGHLLILPLDHKPDLISVDKNTRLEMTEVVTQGIELLKKTINPEGFNVGLNLGSASGGGIPSHLHYHILPRWNGDSNFLPLLAGTKVISVDLNTVFEKLKIEAEKISVIPG